MDLVYSAAAILYSLVILGGLSVLTYIGVQKLRGKL